MAVKQRIIWMADQEWERLGAMARSSGMTRSRVIVGFLSPAKAMRAYVAEATTPDVPRPIKDTLIG